MKKLSIICAFALVFGFMLCPVQAQDLTMDFDGDGVGDTAWNLDPSSGTETVTVDIYVDNWDTGGWPTEPVFGAKMFLTIDNPSAVQLNSCTPYDTANGGIWDPAFSVNTAVDANTQQLEVAIFTCNPITDKLKLFSCELQCIAEEDASGPNIHLDADPGAAGTSGLAGAITPGGAACGAPHGETAGPADVELDQMPPPCQINITPDPVTIAAGASQAFDDGDSGSCIAPDQTWTTDCVNGSIDPGTGVFTADICYGADEVCTVSVSDAANSAACGVPGADCTADVTIDCQDLCLLEIYVGGYPVPPCNTFSKPGRRGLALTCGDTVQFDYCTDCDESQPGQETPCPEWSMAVDSGVPPAGTNLDADGLLTIGPDCTDLEAAAVLAITVTDTCQSVTLSDTVYVTIGEVLLSIDSINTVPGSDGVVVTLNMKNQDHAVKGIQTDIADADNYLSCTSCVADPDRAPEFMCSANEVGDVCRVVLISTNPAGLIEEGDGAVLTINYDVASGIDVECIVIEPTESKVSDRFGDQLCVCEESGEVCFFICGDLYPRECEPDMPLCGDGVVDIFDILEAIDIVLGVVDGSLCQLARADVPTGTPPYCGCIGDEICQTDGIVDIFDVLVIIDMALGKPNCCDYCATGAIY